MGDFSSNTALRYTLALVAVVVTVVLRLLLDPLLNDRLPFITLFAAVSLMAWYGGRGPATVSLLLGLAAVMFFVLEPRRSLEIEHPEDIFGLLFYAVISVGCITLFEQLRGAHRRAEENATEARRQYEQLQRESHLRQKAEAAVGEESERLRVTLASIGDGVITTDAAGRIAFLNTVAQQLTGWTQSELLGRPLEHAFVIVNETTRQPVENPALRSLREGKVVGLANHTLLISKDGTERPIDDSAAPIRGASGNVIGVVLIFRDVTEQRKAEQHRNARLAVTQALDQAPDVREGTRGVLRAVCESLAWEVGFFWTMNPSGDHLECLQSWHSPDLPVAQFEDASYNRTFTKGEGLPGRVWATGQPAWIIDIMHDGNFPRLAAAVHSGLRSAFACPVVVGKRMLGVIEFFTRRIREPDADLLEMMGTVAVSGGQFIERRTAEQELRQSEAELSDFFENASVGLHWVGPDGIILRANQAELDMLGYRRDEYIGRPIADFHADRDVICDILRRLHAGEKLNDFPVRLRCKDGSIKDVLIDSSVMVRDGGFVHTRCFTRDVTERRRGETVLANQKRVLELLVQGAPLPDVLDALCEVIERQSHDRVIATVLLLDESGGRLRSVAGRRVPAAYAQAVDGIRIGPCVGSCGTAAFRCEPVIVTNIAADPLWEGYRELALGHGLRACWSTPIRSSRGQVLGTFAVYYPTPRGPTEGERRLVDILTSTAGVAIERRQAETSLRESEQTARFLADASAALAVLVDFDSTLQKVASLSVPAFADWATVDLAEGDGTLRRLAVSHVDPNKVELARELHRRFPPDPTAPQGVWNILRTGQPELIPQITEDLLVQSIPDDERLRIVRELGLRSYIGVPLKVRGKTLGVLTFIAAESGRVYDATDLAVAKDLADRAAIAVENAELYRELRDADRRKDEFLATLAHELRNPLAPIRNGLQVLRLTGPQDGITGEARSMMERQLNQMVRLVDDLLDVSRITRNKLDLKKQRVELATVIQSAVETSRPIIEHAGHAFTVTLPPTPVHLDADATRLAQVFSNLLNNSAKYTEPGGRISLVAEVSGDEVAVRVRDTGLGIPVEALPRIFEMFSQVDRNMERAQGGLGIGLTLVRRLVEMHGGSVQAHSDGPGKGSEFTVRLPVLNPDRASSRTPTPDHALTASAKHRILIVDDNHDSAMSLGMMLDLLGNETRLAHDGLAAIKAAEEFRPDLMLLDIGLPKLNGYEACRRIREQPWSNGMVIVALTGWGQEEDRRRSQEAGFNHHLVKPVEINSLNELLADLPAVGH